MAAFNNPNLAILELVARALGPVRERVIFVGGCATGLLLTQERPDRLRVTEDVDIVARALTVHDYHAIEKQVRAQGFSNDMRPGAPICRWVYKNVTLRPDAHRQGHFGFYQPLVPAGVAHCVARDLARRHKHPTHHCTRLHRHQAGGL